jgi:hypothetical protein
VLRNAPIRSRFVFTLIVPLLGLAVLAVGGIRADLVESAPAARVHQLARLGADLAPVIHGLQDERSLSANYLADGRRSGAAELAAQRRVADQSVAAYRAAAGGLHLGRGEAAVRRRMDAVTDALGKLPIQRQTIDTSPITPADQRVQPLIAPQERGEPPAQAGQAPNRLGTVRAALDQYTVTIGALIQLNTEIAAGTDNRRLLDGIDAWISLLRASDFVDLQRALLYKVFAQRGFFGGAEHGRLVALTAAEDIDMARFAGFATRHSARTCDLRSAAPTSTAPRRSSGWRCCRTTCTVSRSTRGSGRRPRPPSSTGCARSSGGSAPTSSPPAPPWRPTPNGVRCCTACCWPPRSCSPSACRWSRRAR